MKGHQLLIFIYFIKIFYKNICVHVLKKSILYQIINKIYVFLEECRLNLDGNKALLKII